MSGECDKCGEHCLECSCTTDFGCVFRMPFGKRLNIRASSPIPEDTAHHESIKDVVYNIYWCDEILPWNTKTRAEAFSIALGCQWGAQKMVERFMNV
jgi:hypothetical protein